MVSSTEELAELEAAYKKGKKRGKMNIIYRFISNVMFNEIYRKKRI